MLFNGLLKTNEIIKMATWSQLDNASIIVECISITLRDGNLATKNNGGLLDLEIERDSKVIISCNNKIYPFQLFY